MLPMAMAKWVNVRPTRQKKQLYGNRTSHVSQPLLLIQYMIGGFPYSMLKHGSVKLELVLAVAQVVRFMADGLATSPGRVSMYTDMAYGDTYYISLTDRMSV